MKSMIAGIALVLAAGPAMAEDWTPMSGAEITAALSDAKLNYENGWQEFHADGRTLYNVGEDSWGNWRVTGDQYCSEWPPATTWDCYDMTRNADGSAVRFVWPGDGSFTEGTIAE